MTEHEIIFTGIGGQGIQLMAKVLAQAAAEEGRHAMLFGLYGGAMRGSPSESTLVIGDEPIQAPPIVPRCWSLVVMHPRSLATLLPKLRPGGVLFANATLVDVPPPEGAVRVAIPATRLGEQAGTLIGAGIFMLGGVVAHTKVVTLASVIAAMRASLPSHRMQMADANAALLERGAAWRGDTTPSSPASAAGAV